MREGGRAAGELRPVHLTLDYVQYPEGSVLIAMGNTRVLWNVSVEDKLPRWLLERSGGKQGWLEDSVRDDL